MSRSDAASCGRWFAPMDSRSWVLRRFEVPGGLNPAVALQQLTNVLVSDSYGLASGIKIARDAYNARLVLSSLRTTLNLV